MGEATTITEEAGVEAEDVDEVIMVEDVAGGKIDVKMVVATTTTPVLQPNLAAIVLMTNPK